MRNSHNFLVYIIILFQQFDGVITLNIVRVGVYYKVHFVLKILLNQSKSMF